MRKILPILLLSLGNLSVQAQIISTQTIDSLKRIVSQTENDSSKVKLLAEYSFYVVFTAPEQALSFAREGFLLATSLDYMKGKILCNSSAGFSSWIAGDYAEATEIFLQSVKEAELLKDTGLIFRALDGLVSSYRDQGNHKEALMYARRGLELTSNSSFWKVMTGSVYNSMNQPDSALGFLLPIDPEHSPSFYGYTLFEVGKAYQKKGNMDKALWYYKESIEKLSGSTNIKDLALAYNGVASLFSKQGNLDSCIIYAKRGLEITKRLSYKHGAYESYLLLSNALEPTDKIEAFRYYKLAMETKDEIFNVLKQAQIISSRFAAQLQQIELEKEKLSSQNRIRTITLTSVLIIFIVIMVLLYRNVRLKQKAKNKIERAYSELEKTQAQLIQSEKMASLGELTAGIAHEIQNPLNFVNNFSEVNEELIKELKGEADKGNLEEVKRIANDIEFNSDKINYHGKKVDGIVKNMMQHAHTGSGQKEPTNINALADEYLRLAFHGMRAKDKSFNAVLKTDFDSDVGSVNIIPQEIGRVLLNLYNNAFYAVTEKKSQIADDYEPTVSIRTEKANGKVKITVKDNGSGIPQKIQDKIFQPFFTTKPTGEGTGLGLSLAYDIVTKGHGGELKVETEQGVGSNFILLLPG